MTAHPAAELFPLMTDAELRETADDIREHGLNEPIILLDGLVLDGRNRLRACEMIGVEPRFVDWDGRGGSPVAFVLSENLHRRHLSASQRALIANKARPMFEAEAREAQRGGQGGTLLAPKVEQATREAETARKAATLAGVSTSSVYAAARVEREAPSLVAEIMAGKTSLGTVVREINGTRQTRTHVKDKHAELVKRADAVARMADKWHVSMTDALTPPQARKQLTVLNKAAERLAEVIAAVEYRASAPSR